MNKHTAGSVHPAFVHVIQQITADEAIIVQKMAAQDARLDLYEKTREDGAPLNGTKTLWTQFQELCEAAGVVHLDHDESYLDNLLRLKILAEETWTEGVVRGGGPWSEDSEPSFEGYVHRRVKLSSFGERFVRACIPAVSPGPRRACPDLDFLNDGARGRRALPAEVEAAMHEGLGLLRAQLRSSTQNAASHSVLVVEGWGDGAQMIEAIAAYLVGLLASAVNRALSSVRRSRTPTKTGSNSWRMWKPLPDPVRRRSRCNGSETNVIRGSLKESGTCVCFSPRHVLTCIRTARSWR